MKNVMRFSGFALLALALLSFFPLWATKAAAAPAQEKGVEVYNVILKRPTVKGVQDMVDKASVKELVEAERFFRDNGFWDEMVPAFPNSGINIPVEEIAKLYRAADDWLSE